MGRGNQFCGGGQKMEAKLYMHYRKCQCQFLSLEQETVTAKYVGVNKISREILIKIALLLDS